MRVKNSKILLYVMLDLWSGGGGKCDNRNLPISDIMGRIFLYSGRKSWPHSEIQ